MIVALECSPCKSTSHEPLQLFVFLTHQRLSRRFKNLVFFLSVSLQSNRNHWIQRAGRGTGKEGFCGSAEPALSEVADEPQQGDYSCPIQLRPDFQRHLQCFCWESLTVHTSGLRSFQHQMSLINAVLVLTVNLPYLSRSHLCQETCYILQE